MFQLPSLPGPILGVTRMPWSNVTQHLISELLDSAHGFPCIFDHLFPGLEHGREFPQITCLISLFDIGSAPANHDLTLYVARNWISVVLCLAVGLLGLLADLDLSLSLRSSWTRKQFTCSLFALWLQLSGLSDGHVKTCGPGSSFTSRSKRQHDKADKKDKGRQGSGGKGSSSYGGANGNDDEAGNPNKNNPGGSLRFPSTTKKVMHCPFYEKDFARYRLCGAYTRFSDLTQHLERRHVLNEEKPYCPQCRKEFPDSRSRDHHLRLLRDRPCETASAKDTGMMLPREFQELKNALRDPDLGMGDKMQLVREKLFGPVAQDLPPIEFTQAQVVTIPSALSAVPMALSSSLRRNNVFLHDGLVSEIAKDIISDLLLVSQETILPIAAEDPANPAGVLTSEDMAAPFQPWNF